MNLRPDPCAAICLAVALAPLAPLATAQTPREMSLTVADRITLELTRPNDDPLGRALPIAAHWNTGQPSSGQLGWDPDFVLDYLDAGEFVIPLFRVNMPTQSPEPWSYYQSGLERARRLGLPIAIRFTQWDRPFLDDPDYFGLPAAENPNVVGLDGSTILPLTDPEGPIARWQELGAEWGSQPTVVDIQLAYPDPPLVIWLNNFEHPRLQWGDVDTSWRFLSKHGPGKSDQEKRQILGDGWIARDGALFEALKGQLTGAWQAASIPVCYSAFGRRMYGSWTGWDKKSLHVPDRFAPWPVAVNGSPSYYVFGDPVAHPETDYTVSGPQVAGMNWPFMLDEAFRDAPNYFWEVSAYDGGAERHDWYRNVQGQTYDEARYGGFVRFALWMTRPRILREFRLSKEDRTPYVTYWESVLEAVREVHVEPDLQRFWRKAELVPNQEYPHPFQKKLYPGYTDDDVDRNFLLEASANPQRPWSNDTELAVFAIALVLGERPDREWLLFAYSPLSSRTGVTITIPGYGDVTVDLPRGDGVFVLVQE